MYDIGNKECVAFVLLRLVLILCCTSHHLTFFAAVDNATIQFTTYHRRSREVPEKSHFFVFFCLEGREVKKEVLFMFLLCVLSC